MIGKVFDGKTLVGGELENKLKEIRSLDSFIKVVESMKVTKHFDLSDLKVKKAYAFDAAFGSDDKVINYSSTIIYLVNEDESIGILYNELPENDHVLGQYLNKESNLLITFTVTDQGTLDITEEKIKTSTVLFSDREEDLPENKNYVKGQFKPSDGLELQSWVGGDGCLPGGYQHCGGNCGYPPRDHGGGSPINSTDRCCEGHDRCWANFGNNSPCCDKLLIDCVKGHTTVAAVGIRIWFARNAGRC